MERQVDEGAIFPSREEADHTKPNLFELVAQDQLRDLLHPVVRYVLTVSSPSGKPARIDEAVSHPALP